MAAPGRDTTAAQGSWRARAGLLAWCLALVSGTVLFHSMADGPLAPPPLAPDAWAAWAEGRDPLVATVAVLRLIVLGLSWYLVGATSVGILARVLRAARLIRLADALTVPALRRLLQAALGVSLATAMVVSAATPRADVGLSDGASSNVEVVDATGSPEPGGSVVLAADQPSTDEPADAHRTAPDQVRLTAADGEPSQVTITGADDGDAADDRMTRPPGLDVLEGQGTPGSDSRGGGDEGRRGGIGAEHPGDADGSLDGDDTRDAVIAAGPDGAGNGRTVSAGESFWRIADDALTGHLDRAPTDREVAAYVERIVDRNRDRLADPENPDLIFPGQEFDLPPLAPEGEG